MFVINPDPFLQPAYRISPFQTEYVAFHATLPKDDFSFAYLNQKIWISTLLV